MKISNKQKLKQIIFNDPSDIDFRDFMNLSKKYTSKPYSFLVMDATIASHNHLRFRNKFLERIQKLFVTIDDKLTVENLQYNINREAAKISASSAD